MLGLFGTLNLATRSLSTQQFGTEVAGHNLANVNNPAYARQRVAIQTSITMPTELGPQGTGADGVGIVQLRDLILDAQIESEASVRGSLQAQQLGLQYAQANLGQQIDRQAAGADSTSATSGVGGQNGLAENLTDLFNGFHSLSTNPTSTAERQVLLIKAQNLTTQFNQVSSRLQNVNESLNQSIQSDVEKVNLLIGNIAELNQQIVSIEVGGAGQANDLRDIRQQRIEELSELVNLETINQLGGAVDIAIDGVAFTSGTLVLERLESYDPGNGQLLLRAQNAGTSVNLTSGSLQGTIEVRDGALTQLRDEIDTLATQLITQVNTVHVNGYGLNGTTGEAFFTGTDAGTIAVNSVLLPDPSRIQAAGVAGAPGDNQVALALAQLANRPVAALGNQTFGQNYGQTVARIGQSLSSVNTQIENQSIVERMLMTQRDSTSGVSLDEEMTDLIKYQKAFQASARLISTLDEMLDIVVNMKR